MILKKMFSNLDTRVQKKKKNDRRHISDTTIKWKMGRGPDYDLTYNTIFRPASGGGPRERFWGQKAQNDGCVGPHACGTENSNLIAVRKVFFFFPTKKNSLQTELITIHYYPLPVIVIYQYDDSKDGGIINDPREWFLIPLSLLYYDRELLCETCYTINLLKTCE